MAQLVTINVAQLVTIKMAKRGPVSNFTTYIYICMYVCMYMCVDIYIYIYAVGTACRTYFGNFQRETGQDALASMDRTHAFSRFVSGDM